MRHPTLTPFFVGLFFLLVSCTATPVPTQSPVQMGFSTQNPTQTVLIPPTPEPARVFTICMVGEPNSLFLYGDSSVAARSVREAIYDGPFDTREYEVLPVILQAKPSLSQGDASLESVKVNPGELIVDSQGNLTNLDKGLNYLPAGCKDSSCAQTYSGSEPASMDQLVVQFKLLPGVQWSDGAALTADDSVYSFEVAKSIFPRVRSDLLSRTQSYQAVDELTVEWKGVPGFLDANYATNFFTPLPRHAWNGLSSQELFTSPMSSQLPIGWGAYKIDEWTKGDHITLSRNPSYFRAKDGLPHFEKLVFRFVTNGDEALSALLAGECDYVDETTNLETQNDQLLQLQATGKIAVEFETGTAWEHADFGIASLDTQIPSLFKLKETRQAIAMCIDRKSMADELFFGKSQVPDTYVPPGDPLNNPDARHYDFDPQTAARLLQSVGWLDSDQDPSTPRVAQGVAGVPDGTRFEFDFLTTNEAEKQKAAQILQGSLAQCGIRVNIKASSWDELLAPGPDGPVFGRKFSMAQFAWVTASEPPCFLYTTQEIPGPYPDFPKGWGGANDTGYSSQEFDQACRQARFSLPDTPEHQQAIFRAQAIYADELPSIPLYLHLKLVAMRPDMCNVIVDSSAESALWNLEAFDYGEGCAK